MSANSIDELLEAVGLDTELFLRQILSIHQSSLESLLRGNDSTDQIALFEEDGEVAVETSIILVDATLSDVTLTLPDVDDVVSETAGTSKIFTFKRTDVSGNTVLIETSTGSPIIADLTDYVGLTTDGSVWFDVGASTGGGVTTETAYMSRYNAAGIQSFPVNTATVFTFPDLASSNDAASFITYDNGTGEFTFVGDHVISIWGKGLCDNTSSARSNFDTSVEVFPDSGTEWEQVPGGASSSYHRNTNDGRDAPDIDTAIFEVFDGDRLRVTGTPRNSDLVTIPQGVVINIQKMVGNVLVSSDWKSLPANSQTATVAADLPNYPVDLDTFTGGSYDEAAWRRLVNTEDWSDSGDPNVLSTLVARDLSTGLDAVYTIFDGALTAADQTKLAGLATGFPGESDYTKAVINKAGTRRPNRNDDITYGVGINDLWHDARINRTYICDSNEVGRARWRRLGSPWFILEQAGHSFPADTDGVFPAYIDSSGDWHPSDATDGTGDLVAYGVVVKTDGDFLWVATDDSEVYMPAHGLSIGSWYTITDPPGGGDSFALVEEGSEPGDHVYRQRVCFILDSNRIVVRVEDRASTI